MEPCTDELIYEMVGSLNANAKDAMTLQNLEHIAPHLFVPKQVNVIKTHNLFRGRNLSQGFSWYVKISMFTQVYPDFNR